jgi:hypothetical protein
MNINVKISYVYMCFWYENLLLLNITLIYNNYAHYLTITFVLFVYYRKMSVFAVLNYTYFIYAIDI